jgi:hypothetical protein
MSLNPVSGVVDFHAQLTLGTTAPAVPTELPAAQAITSAAANIPAARNHSTEKGIPGTSRVVIIDPQTNEVVFRSLDAYTGGVIEQTPAAGLLRQRAYEGAQAVQALIEGKNQTTAMLEAMEKVDTTT